LHDIFIYDTEKYDAFDKCGALILMIRGAYFRNKCFQDRKDNPSADKLWTIGTVLFITTASIIAYIMDET
jgi:hypothetical protein